LVIVIDRTSLDKVPGRDPQRLGNQRDREVLFKRFTKAQLRVSFDDDVGLSLVLSYRGSLRVVMALAACSAEPPLCKRIL